MLIDVVSGEEIARTQAHVRSTDSVVSTGSLPRADQSSIRGANLMFRAGSRLITHHIKIAVRDNGIGVDLEARTKLFGIFRQAQRSAGGTGLGLFR